MAFVIANYYSVFPVWCGLDTNIIRGFATFSSQFIWVDGRVADFQPIKKKQSTGISAGAGMSGFEWNFNSSHILMVEC